MDKKCFQPRLFCSFRPLISTPYLIEKIPLFYLLLMAIPVVDFSRQGQRYTYKVLQTIQMKLILLCVWAELAVLGSAKTGLKFKYEIYLANTYTIQCMGQGISLKSERNNQ